jgi:acetylornithine deacetylase/succinyl-diaminopimelate desuccinylase-like protein
MSPSRALAYARAHRKKSLAELMEFVRFPTVSAQPRYEGDIRNCAHWLAGHLRRIGLDDVRIFPTARHPLVYGSWQGAPGRPTLLIYGHYDVQPADPLHEWRSLPFEPTIRGADLFGRGACDDKGQMFTHVKALEAYLRTVGALPVNVKCLFEGEEEIGSPNLLPFVVRNKHALAADAAVMSDTRMLGPNRPAISYAERGALQLEIDVRGPEHDLHSGNFGGAVHNPLQALCEIIAKLHDANGCIAIPGLYDSVRGWSKKERAHMARAGPSDAQILDNAQIDLGWGERGYSLYQRLTLRPALTINGIIGGYQGPGGKGVIPARAGAKLSFRLVPDQDPRDVDRLFRQHIDRITPPTVRSTVNTLSRAVPVLIDPQHPAVRAAALAYRKGFGVAPVFLRSGGTIPILNTFQKTLGIPTVLMGFALPDDRMHAPNEKFHIPNFFKGIKTSIWFMDALAGLHGPRVYSSPRVGREQVIAEKSTEAVL